MDYFDTLSYKNSPKNSNIACVVMASGEGRRFGGNKLTAQLLDKPLILWAADNAKAVFSHIAVVTRCEKVAELCRENNIDVVLHSLGGRNDTIRLGLEHFGDSFDGCIFCQGDQPLLSAETLRNMAEAFDKNKDKIIRLEYNGQPSSPVIFPKWVFESLKNLPFGKGGNVVVKNNTDKVMYISAGSIFETKDVDTKENLQELTEYLNNCK